MKKIFIFLFICASTQALFSQEEVPIKKTQKGFLEMDFISVKMPDDRFGNPEENMGFTGVHYNLWLLNNVYGGLGFYGSITGKRGGFFTLGINAGIKKQLTSKLFIDTGFHFGGGGGAGAPDGGGAFILPHFNLGYQFKNFSATAGYSYINFFDQGNIVNQQLNIGVQIPVSFDYADFSQKEKRFSMDELVATTWNQPSKRFSFLFHLNNLSPYGNSALTDGSSLSGKKIHLAGFEINSYFKENWFGFFKADGAYHGIQGGYMDIFLGAGYHHSMNKNRTNLLIKFGVGAGGGGGVDTAGGFLIYPDISLEQKLFGNVFVSVNKGYLMNVNNHFSASTLGIGLKYYSNNQGIISKNNTNFSSSKIKGIQVIVGHEMYISAQRMLQPTEHLHQIALQVNLFLTKNIYAAGQTSFANFGNAGAYAEGIVGLGVSTNPIANNKLTLFTQVLGGAAGGGDISTGQGFIIKPSVGLDYILNNSISLRTSIGKVKARGGSLNSTSVNFSFNYNIGFLTSK